MIQKVIDVAYHSWSILMKYFWTDYEIHYKTSKNDPVTIADRESELYLRDALQEIIPWSQILWEEWDDSIDEYSWYVWIVDPLDWTKNFTNWVERFWTLIWLCKDWEPVLWVCFFPKIWKLYYAEKWSGSYVIYQWETQKITVDEKRTDAILPWEPTWSCSWLTCCMIAEWMQWGILKKHNRNWKRDFCWPQVILEESWWVLTDSNNNPIDYTTKNNTIEHWSIAANKSIHKYLSSLL